MRKNYFLIVLAMVFTVNAMAQNIPSYVPKDGLVGYWPFNGNANDESGNGNNGTVNGATLTDDRNGVANSAYNFDNFGDIKVSNFKFQNYINSGFSISYWFTMKDSTSTNGDRNFLITNYDGVNGLQIEYNPNSKFTLRHSLRTASSNPSEINYHQPFEKFNTWKNVTFIWTTSKKMLTYVNGVLTNTTSGENITNLSVCCGITTNFGSMQGSSSYHNGKLDDIAIYNRSLTQQEITALYNNGSQSALASTKVFVDAPTTVNQNDTLELSISTETLNSSDNVIAFQTDFAYDSTKYTYVNNHVVGTLNANGTVVVNSSKNGKLSISYMAQTALNGAGSLVKLKFKANATLGQGIFSLANFMYNNTDITALKSDTVNTIDVTPPRASITYSQNPVRKGDSLLITVKFNEKMADAPVTQLRLTGENTLTNSNLTKVNDSTYTYWWVVEKGNGLVNVTLASGKDVGGNVIVATPTQNANFTVLPTLFGDIDTNKFVRAFDAALALQYSVGLNPLPTMDPLPWSNWRIAVANVDTVGNVTANDASLILQHSAKVITSFPADAKKRGEAPVANITVTQEANQLVFRATGTLYAFNVFMKDNFNAFGQPEVKDKNAMIATNITSTTYKVGLASTTPFAENEPFLVIPILTNENVQGTMDIVANTQEKALAYGTALSILEINKEMLIVYPNPTKDIVTIKNAQGNTLRILNVEGKEVYNQKMTGNTMDISLKTLGAKGMYILHIEDANNERIQSKQIILE